MMLSKERFLLILVIFSTICCGCVAESVNTAKITTNLINAQKEINDISYTEKLIIPIENGSTSTKSDFSIRKPNLYKKVDWINSSIHLITVSNETSSWIYDPTTNTILMKNSTSLNSVANLPAYKNFILNMSDNCTMNYQETEFLGGVQIYKLEVISNKQNETCNRHILWIDPEIWMPLKIQSYNGDNPLMTLEYSNYSINTGLETNEFEFKVPKTASVVGS